MKGWSVTTLREVIKWHHSLQIGPSKHYIITSKEPFVQTRMTGNSDPTIQMLQQKPRLISPHFFLLLLLYNFGKPINRSFNFLYVQSDLSINLNKILDFPSDIWDRHGINLRLTGYFLFFFFFQTFTFGRGTIPISTELLQPDWLKDLLQKHA